MTSPNAAKYEQEDSTLVTVIDDDTGLKALLKLLLAGENMGIKYPFPKPGMAVFFHSVATFYSQNKKVTVKQAASLRQALKEQKNFGPLRDWLRKQCPDLLKPPGALALAANILTGKDPINQTKPLPPLPEAWGGKPIPADVKTPTDWKTYEKHPSVPASAKFSVFTHLGKHVVLICHPAPGWKAGDPPPNMSFEWGEEGQLHCFGIVENGIDPLTYYDGPVLQMKQGEHVSYVTLDTQKPVRLAAMEYHTKKPVYFKGKPKEVWVEQYQDFSVYSGAQVFKEVVTSDTDGKITKVRVFPENPDYDKLTVGMQKPGSFAFPHVGKYQPPPSPKPHPSEVPLFIGGPVSGAAHPPINPPPLTMKEIQSILDSPATKANMAAQMSNMGITKGGVITLDTESQDFAKGFMTYDAYKKSVEKEKTEEKAQTKAQNFGNAYGGNKLLVTKELNQKEVTDKLINTMVAMANIADFGTTADGMITFDSLTAAATNMEEAELEGFEKTKEEEPKKKRDIDPELEDMGF